jgi:ribosomal 30S subunit maturation factor RimM
LVLIGKILRTRGNKGEVVISFSPGIVIPQEGSEVELRSSKRIFPQKIEHISAAGDEAIASLSGAHSIGEALRFVGCALWADVPEAGSEAGEGFLGFRVFDLQGECWGTVESQSHFSLNQLLEIKDPSCGEIIYVPWHESLVVRIDRAAGILVIDPPQGLRELNK